MKTTTKIDDLRGIISRTTEEKRTQSEQTRINLETELAGLKELKAQTHMTIEAADGSDDTMMVDSRTPMPRQNTQESDTDSRISQLELAPEGRRLSRATRQMIFKNFRESEIAACRLQLIINYGPAQPCRCFQTRKVGRFTTCTGTSPSPSQ